MCLSHHVSFQGDDKAVHEEAFKNMREQICAATTTMTSVPKPLKFLRPHYEKIKAAFGSLAEGDVKVWGVLFHVCGCCWYVVVVCYSACISPRCGWC